MTYTTQPIFSNRAIAAAALATIGLAACNHSARPTQQARTTSAGDERRTDSTARQEQNLSTSSPARRADSDVAENTSQSTAVDADRAANDSNREANEATREATDTTRRAANDSTAAANATAGSAAQDSNAAVPTADDQSNEATDLEITRAIRENITANASLSMRARAATVVVTQNSVVTLRGRVASNTERDTIENAARTARGVTRVDNLLVVRR